MPSIQTPLPAKVKIELATDVLKQLIYKGSLKGNDCRCLDNAAKQVLWQTLLTSSIDNKEI